MLNVKILKKSIAIEQIESSPCVKLLAKRYTQKFMQQLTPMERYASNLSGQESSVHNNMLRMNFAALRYYNNNVNYLIMSLNLIYYAFMHFA